MTHLRSRRTCLLAILAAVVMSACGAGDAALRPTAVDDGLYTSEGTAGREADDGATVAREPRPRAPDTPTPSPTASSTVEHPAPAPPRPAADASEVSLDALAPLEFGMTPDEAAVALGVRWLDDGSYDFFRAEYECGYLQPLAGDFPPGIVFMFTGPDERLARIDVIDPRWRSAVDLGVGDPVAGLLDQHDDATVEPDVYDEDRLLVSLPPDATGIRYVFEVDAAGVVDGIRYGEVDETSWPEGCL